MYPNTLLHINGQWCPAASGRTLPVVNPANHNQIGTVAFAEKADLDRALEAAEQGFKVWRKVSAFERCKLMRKAAEIFRERAETVATCMTFEQGKPIGEARMETLAGADLIDWFAEEGRRAYGRVIPARAEGVYQLVVKEPVGPVAAFTPWNFPINQAVRKLSAALATGCSIILKAPEETPASPAELVRAFVDAGVPPGVINLVYGNPADISSYLIPHPVIRKMSFTGSTAVGKHLAAMVGQHMKRATMELGGHAPVIVFEDADIDLAAKTMTFMKYRNAGQVCVSPTRFLVQEGAYRQFVDKFVENTKAIKVGDGFDKDTRMATLANPRRQSAMVANVEDAKKQGGKVQTGGYPIGEKGNFFEPTVITELSTKAMAMNNEPFGPLAIINPFKTLDDAVTEANRLAYGLAAYAWTRSAKTATAVAAQVETGMMTINHLGFALPEVPFGGVKDSGYGTEGGCDATDPYLVSKFVTQAGL
ncbi:MAG: NAD-dependent succinate-semialdehyde dehydrogenase [Burkholderiales bacterium]